jgi:Spy/CpxP family protein refolding chaperone
MKDLFPIHGRHEKLEKQTSDHRLATATNKKGEKEMKRTNLAILVLILAAMMTILVVSPAVSQDKPADNMQILRDKVKADKKLLVAANMELTESEAKGFWPVYEKYQKDLSAINKRIARLIMSYAEGYRAGNITDEKARKLTSELVAIQKSEGGLQASYVPKLSKVLPPKKVARYLQIENKIRAAVKYDLAAEIPLVE